VFINELPLAAAPVDTAATAEAAGAVIASFAKGSDQITRVTSWYDFSQKFGGYDKSYPSTFAIGSFFKNGGTELYVKRVLPAASKRVAKANLTITSGGSGTLCTFAAKNRGVNGNDIRVVVSASRTIREAGYYDIKVFLEGASPATSSNTTDDTLVEEFNGVVFHDALSGDYVVTVLEFGSAYIRVLEGAVVEYDDNGDEVTPRVTYTVAKNVAFIPNPAVLVLAGAPTVSRSLTYADYTGNTVYNPTGAVPGVFSVANCAVLKEFEVLNQPLVFFLPDVVNTVKNNSVSKSAVITNSARSGTSVTITTQATHNFVVGETVVVAGTNGNPSIEGTWVITEVNVSAKTFKYDSIASGAITSAADTGTAVVNPTGGWDVAQYVYKALLNWVETDDSSKRHFVVVETASDLTVTGALNASGDLDETSRGAVYYPHVFIKDPIGRSGNAIRKIGPSAAVAGLFLATDRRVGPFKVAAGIDAQVTDALALERSFTPSELDQLNSGSNSAGITGLNVVNAIRNLPGAGIVVMGGRTLLQDGTANRYINMRRSLSYIEKRLNDLASFAVFENNTETLWSRLITVLGVFLNEYRNQGGLRGTTVEESFYIKCDEENNTPTTIANGEVHIEIGVALEYPAEFVVINLSQKTAE
jgi:phage tail sheath protein FI